MNVFSGLKNVMSRDCIRCVLWDGSDNMTAMSASNFNSSQALGVTAVPI
jgi:hypothetical protein